MIRKIYCTKEKHKKQKNIEKNVGWMSEIKKDNPLLYMNLYSGPNNGRMI